MKTQGNKLKKTKSKFIKKNKNDLINYTEFIKLA